MYSEKNYKMLFIPPVIIAVIFLFFATQIEPGIEFTGGTVISFPTNVSPVQVKEDLSSRFDLEELKARSSSGAISGIIIEFKGERTLVAAEEAYKSGDYQAVFSTLGEPVPAEGNLSELAFKVYNEKKTEFKSSLSSFITETYHVSSKDISSREVGPSLGAVFLSQMQNALIFSFILMSILVFVFFRKVLVSFAVIQAAVFDVIVGLGFIGMMKIPLSLAAVAPLLMLIGYSVDTDIMLSERVLSRKEGSPENRIKSAMRTGFTMTGTTLAALVALYAAASFGGVETLAMIAMILFVGLLGDLVSTWCTNASILLWISRRRKK